MIASLDKATFRRHVGFMPTKPQVDGDTLKVGRAVAFLRERVGLTQAQAAEAVPAPGMTNQYWQMHEAGRVPGIHKPATQRKLIEALNAASGVEPPLTMQDLEAAIAGGDHPIGRSVESRMARIAREVAGPPTPKAASTPAPAQAVFPTRDGDVVFNYPPNMTPEGYRDLEAYFAVFLTTRRGEA